MQNRGNRNSKQNRVNRKKGLSYLKSKTASEKKRENPYLAKFSSIAKNYIGVDPENILTGDVSQALASAEDAMVTTENMEIIGEALRRQMEAMARQAEIREAIAGHALATAKTIGQSENATNTKIREFLESMSLNAQKHDIGDAYGEEKTRSAFLDANQSFQLKLQALIDSRKLKSENTKDSETKRNHQAMIEGYRRELKAFAAGNSSPLEAKSAFQALNGAKPTDKESANKSLLGSIFDTVAKVVR